MLHELTSSLAVYCWVGFHGAPKVVVLGLVIGPPRVVVGMGDVVVGRGGVGSEKIIRCNAFGNKSG